MSVIILTVIVTTMVVAWCAAANVHGQAPTRIRPQVSTGRADRFWLQA